jgi:hypothetical protein
MVRVRYSGAASARGFQARQRVYAQKMRELRAMRANPTGAAPAIVPTVQARTVFVWPRMGLHCGIAEYVRHLVEVSDGGVACKKTGEIIQAEHVVLVLMPSLEEPVPSLVSFIRRMRGRGTRVTLDVHHMTVGQNPFAALVQEATDTVWRHPRMPELGGGGRYVPLPVPTLPRPDVQRLGGLAHFGLGHVSKRLPIMAQVAAALGTRLYVYGERNREHVPAALAGHVTCSESFLGEHELCQVLRHHDVGLIGRARWSPQTQLNGSASARFLMGVGLPTVVDRAEAHEDLEGVLDVVPFDDLPQLVARVRMLVEDAGYRAQAIERAGRYAAATSPRRVAEQMGVAVKP